MYVGYLYKLLNDELDEDTYKVTLNNYQEMFQYSSHLYLNIDTNDIRFINNYIGYTDNYDNDSIEIYVENNVDKVIIGDSLENSYITFSGNGLCIESNLSKENIKYLYELEKGYSYCGNGLILEGNFEYYKLCGTPILVPKSSKDAKHLYNIFEYLNKVDNFLYNYKKDAVVQCTGVENFEVGAMYLDVYGSKLYGYIGDNHKKYENIHEFYEVTTDLISSFEEQSEINIMKGYKLIDIRDKTFLKLREDLSIYQSLYNYINELINFKYTVGLSILAQSFDYMYGSIELTEQTKSVYIDDEVEKTISYIKSIDKDDNYYDADSIYFNGYSKDFILNKVMPVYKESEKVTTLDFMEKVKTILNIED